jgi:hypothetical protein
VNRVAISWPAGRVDEFKNVATGRTYACMEGEAIRPLDQR